MDTSDPDIFFDDSGKCNHCKEYDIRAKNELHLDEAGQQKLHNLVDKIKQEGKKGEYDCVIGLSGGVDSSMTAYIVKRKLGLRPLALHLDNGWDTELSVKNIENIVKKLDIDFHTHVLDWEEFKDLQLSFLKASVVNLEMPTDHAITSLLVKEAAKRGIRYIILGGNVVTEAIMPNRWRGHDNRDWKNIKAIHKKYGTKKLRSFLHLTFLGWAYFTLIKGIRFVNILNYFPYNKKQATQVLEKELCWRPYGAKHYESLYTRFFQSYYLPKKFNYDKRRGYLSALICSNQITREEALNELENDPCSPDQLAEDKCYVIKKLGLNEKSFQQIMVKESSSHQNYSFSSFLSNKNSLYKLAKKIITLNLNQT